MTPDRAALVDRITVFLSEIGIPVRAATLPDDTFLPGMEIRRGELVYDPARPFAPGDLLHEAGHLAVTAPEHRSDEPFVSTEGDEMATLAWSWAAARRLGLAAADLFHDGGYKGEAAWLAETFEAGYAPGLPMLQYYGLTIAPNAATPDGPPPYPHMIRWLR
ncbi:MAG: hypothetical protein KF842_08875 [Caulobacter sp.]|nr:hypothetical protein [Caulobacter sp.]